MKVTAKADYAVRALVELAAAGAGTPVKAQRLADAQRIPLRFLLNILGELKAAKLVESRRGSEGGYWLARPPGDVTVADVVRAVEGPLADVRGMPPELLELSGAAEPMRAVWLSVRASLRRVLEHVTLAQVAADELPDAVLGELDQPGAERRR